MVERTNGFSRRRFLPSDIMRAVETFAGMTGTGFTIRRNPTTQTARNFVFPPDRFLNNLFCYILIGRPPTTDEKRYLRNQVRPDSVTGEYTRFPRGRRVGNFPRLWIPARAQRHVGDRHAIALRFDRERGTLLDPAMLGQNRSPQSISSTR